MLKLAGKNLLLLSVLFIASVCPVFAQGTSDKIAITGDKFEIDETARRAVFTGNVVVEQKNFKLLAPRLVARYGEGGTSDLQEVIVEGGIRIEQPNQTATSDHGIYDPKLRMLRMIGNVVATRTDTGDIVKGAEMTVDLKTGTTSFIAGGEKNNRVTAVFGSSE